MPPECSIICIDNSEWMRNGDFAPTRMQCQREAVSVLVQCKLHANPENTVGLISMAGGVEVLVMGTRESGQLFTKLHETTIKGESNFVSGIKVAHMALKHRSNRNHKMRAILFVGSPIPDVDNDELNKFARQMKKDSAEADVICFGEWNCSNEEIMRRFIATVNGRQGRGSNLLIVPRGDSLTDKLLSSPICRGEDGAAPIPSFAALTAGTATDSAENDPELAMALRLSLEEQRRTQPQQDTLSNAPTSTPPPQTTENAPQQVTGTDPSLLPEDQQLEWALRLSMQGSCTGTGRHPISTASATFPLSASEQSTAAANVTTLPVGRQVEIDIKPPSAESRQSSDKKNAEKPDEVHKR